MFLPHLLQLFNSILKVATETAIILPSILLMILTTTAVAKSVLLHYLKLYTNMIIVVTAIAAEPTL